MSATAEKPVISILNLTKRFGRTTAVDTLDLTVRAGSIYGFLGPNGAGKSTTINLLLDIIRPTGGVIEIFGRDARRVGPDLRRDIGYIAGDGELCGNWTGWRYISFVGQVSGAWSPDRARELAGLLTLDVTKKIRELSRGNRQKVSIVAMLARDTKLLILDEPTSGLDPLVQQQFRKLITDYRANGGTVFISSHELDEVEALCDDVGFIREGKLIAQGSFSELSRQISKVVTVRAPADVLDAIVKLPGVEAPTRHDGALRFRAQGSTPALIARLPLDKLDDITVAQPSLETVFLQYYDKEQA